MVQRWRTGVRTHVPEYPHVRTHGPEYPHVRSIYGAGIVGVLRPAPRHYSLTRLFTADTSDTRRVFFPPSFHTLTELNFVATARCPQLE